MVIIKTEATSALAVYEAQVALRKELRSQVERLEEQRGDLANSLRSEEATATERAGLESRLRETDARLSSLEQQLAQADLSVAKAAAVPGAVVEPPPVKRDGPPEEVFMIPIVFTIFVLAPIAIAYARRIWKRGATVIAPIPREVTDRLDAMGQAVESIAVEVERIGEGQRFLTRVMSDPGRQLGQGAAQPIPVGQAAAQAVGQPEHR
ncbi:MAG: hypothetical protein ACK6DP_19935 [Gemmatimonas sp.]|uniref:hypothetical protein n=1 Tax=Gemmatimonas sp. TaxID=1962908 RepID=UPI00391F2BDD